MEVGDLGVVEILVVVDSSSARKAQSLQTLNGLWPSLALKAHVGLMSGGQQSKELDSISVVSFSRLGRIRGFRETRSGIHRKGK